MNERRPLWAPWRMAYIKDPERQTRGCFLCAAVPNDELLVWHDDNVVVMLNRFPYNPGHMLIAPRAHLSDYARLPQPVAVALDAGVRRTIRVLESALAADGYNVGINLGTAAGAGLPEHVHVHVVPRWNGDNNFMPIVAETRVIPQLLEQTAAELRAAFARVDE